MEEAPKIHHHKSKHRKSSSRRSETGNNNVIAVKTKKDTTDPECGDVIANDTPTTGQSVVMDVVPTPTITSDDRQTLGPIEPAIVVENITTDERQIQKGILGFMDREIKTQRKPLQSLSDPTASPAQRSIRSRSSIEKSPRSKRSKSESRRRKERKLIAAGELEVKQANETLMRYLKQCSELNDASLSGELEIDKSIDDRRVQRKTKSQRDKRSNVGSVGSNGSGSGIIGTAKSNGSSYIRDRLPPSGLSSILQELASDIVPSHGEIYNPFTPVISPTDGSLRTDRMFIQTPHGFRTVTDNTFFKESIHDIENNGSSISSGVNLSCFVQRIWILISNICHGLLGGLALAHILFLITTTPKDWTDGSIKHYSTFAELYTNTFYCLAIVCLVSIFDRMDICRWNVFTSMESISFQWIIIVMLYLTTIVLSLSAESMDGGMYMNKQNATAWEHGVESHRVLNIWNSMSLARSIAAIIGWIMIGLNTSDNLLYNHLIELEKYQQNNN